MILRSVLTEMEKPFCEEDCPGPLPLPRRAHTDRAEIIRQRRREYGRFRWRKHPISLLTGSGTSPAVRSAEERKHRTGCSSCVARAAVYLLSRLPRGNWALFPRLLHKTICAICADREGNSHRTSTALSVKSQAQKIVASRASVGTGRRFLAINTWSVRRPTPTILAEISWPPTFVIPGKCRFYFTLAVFCGRKRPDFPGSRAEFRPILTLYDFAFADRATKSGGFLTITVAISPGENPS